MEPEIDCKMQSNSRYMLWASTCAIAASVVLLASCSVFQPVIDVVPVGGLQQGVVFCLGDTFRQRQEFTVTAVTVLRSNQMVQHARYGYLKEDRKEDSASATSPMARNILI